MVRQTIIYFPCDAHAAFDEMAFGQYNIVKEELMEDLNAED